MPLVIGAEEKYLAFTPEFGVLVNKFGKKGRKHWRKPQLKELMDWFASVGGPYPEDQSRGNINQTFEDPNASLEQRCIDRYIAMREHRNVTVKCGGRRPTQEGPPKSYTMEPPHVLISNENFSVAPR